MAQLTITIPDAQVPRVRAAFAKRLGLAVQDVDAEAIRLELVNLVKIIVRVAEEEEAAAAARAGVTEVDPA